MDLALTIGVLAAESGEGGGEEGGGGNFLVPNGTFLFELLFFLLLLFILGRFVVPPITRAMRERAQLVQQGVDDAQEAKAKDEQARKASRAELDEARGEAAKIRDKARAEADKLAEGKRREAQADATETREQGEEALREQREQARRELHQQVGGLALTLASRILGEVTAEDEQVRHTIDDFLADIDPPEGASPVPAVVSGDEG